MCMQLCRAINITADATLGVFLQEELLTSDFTSNPCKFYFIPVEEILYIVHVKIIFLLSKKKKKKTCMDIFF